MQQRLNDLEPLVVPTRPRPRIILIVRALDLIQRSLDCIPPARVRALPALRGLGFAHAAPEAETDGGAGGWSGPGVVGGGGEVAGFVLDDEAGFARVERGVADEAADAVAVGGGELVDVLGHVHGEGVGEFAAGGPVEDGGQVGGLVGAETHGGEWGLEGLCVITEGRGSVPHVKQLVVD